MGKQAKPVGKRDDSYGGPTFSDPPSNCMKIHRDKKLSQIRMTERKENSRKTKIMDKRCLKMKKGTDETWHLPIEWLRLFRLDCLLPQLS